MGLWVYRTLRREKWVFTTQIAVAATLNLPRRAGYPTKRNRRNDMQQLLANERLGQIEPVGGPGTNYEAYFALRDRTANPVFRQIYDAFRFADLRDTNLRLLVQRLAGLGNHQLTAHCNQYSISVMALLRERDAIMSTLHTHEMPYTLAAWKLLGASEEDLDVPWTFAFEEVAEALGDIVWSIPLTPRQCLLRLEGILAEVTRWHRQRTESEAGGYFYDTWPLLAHFAKPPQQREREDITPLLPFFYQEAFRYCAITSESLLGHIEAVNADAILQTYGGLSLRPEQLRTAGLLPEPDSSQRPRR